MKERIDKIVGGNKSKEAMDGNFSFCFSRILRIESEKIHYPRNFTIYDTADSKVLSSIIKDLNLDKDIYKFGTIQNRISSLNNFITPNRYKNYLNLHKQTKNKRTEFGRIYHLCTRWYKSGVMDFDDLLIKTYKLLEDFPESLYKYQNQFKYILVDEYQDTNHIQYLIIKKLAFKRKHMCCKDDAQSIYGTEGLIFRIF